MQSGIPYFPLDVRLGDSYSLLESEFGLKAFAVIVKLLQKIYGEFGYYCEWTKDVCALFSRQICENSALVNEIAKAAVRRGIFDSSLFEKHRILTSRIIQERYFSAVSRRKSVEADERYLLIFLSDFKNVNISGKNADNFKQRKEKKTKENKNKEDETKEDENKSAHIAAKDKERAAILSSDTSTSISYSQSLNNSNLLSGAAYERLKSEFGQEKTDEYLSKIARYCKESGHYYRDFEAAVKKWICEDIAAEKLKNRETKPKILLPLSKISNYNDTNKIDYDAWQEKVLNDMLSS